MKSILRVIQLLLLFTFTSVGAQKSTRLNEGWEFLKQDLGGIWEAVRPIGVGAPESVPIWDSVSLPHCVNAQDAVDPDPNYYQGPAWYRTRLSLSNPYQGGRTLLHFEGAGQKTEVYVYTTKVGEHVGGYDEWTVDITDAVDRFKKIESAQKQFAGKIPISIRVDNSRNLEIIPSNLSDFTLYGGIYRYLNLVYVPSVSFDQVFAQAETDAAGKKGSVKVKARFYDPLKINKGEVSVSLIDPAGKTIKSSTTSLSDFNSEKTLAEFSIDKVKMWSDVSPILYQVEVKLKFQGGEAVQREKIGFRHFEFLMKGPFHLNGKRLLLRGTHRHEDHAGVGAAMTESMIRKEMLMMKEIGINFIRLGHYQQSRIVLNLCDSLGIMVWEEIPWCRGGLGGDVYKMQAKRMLTNMIQQHYNHPSVIIWGLGNENDWPGDFPEFDKEKIRAFMTELNQLSHTLDPARKTGIRRVDFCKDIVDVYSPSIWSGWYRGLYKDYKPALEAELQKVNHMLHMEWGGDSHAGRHSEDPDAALAKISGGKEADERLGDATLYGGSTRVSKDGDWSESYICNLIDWHLKEHETMTWLAGAAYWPFKDFSTPIRPENPVPFVNQKGVVERDLTRKESFYVFQSWWTEKPMVHIYGHGWPVRWGKKDELRMVKAYSNCEKAELFVNGKSAGVKVRNGQDFPAAGLRWMINFKEGKNELRVVATKGKTIVEDTLTFQYQTEMWEKPSRLLFRQINEADGISTVEVVAVDEKNIRCLDARNYVRFTLVGEGSLIDNQGTSSGSSYLQMYNGRAIIRVKINNGSSVISAKSEDIPSVFLDLGKPRSKK